MITIALADDHAITRNAITCLLESTNNYVVSIKAENGFQLINDIQNSKNLPNIVLLDMKMPLLDGVTTAHYLKTHFPNILIIAISSNFQFNIIQDIFDIGVMGFLDKTFLTDANLKKCLNSVLSGIPFIEDGLFDKKLISFCFKNCSKDSGNSEISKKEKTYLQLVATSLSNEEIAQIMNVSFDSIYNYQKSLKLKLGYCTRRELTTYAIQHRIARIARF